MSSGHAGRPICVRAWATVVLASRGSEVAAWPLRCFPTPDLSTVESLARAQLAARRLGWNVYVRDAAPALVELLELAGLDLGVEVSG